MKIDFEKSKWYDFTQCFGKTDFYIKNFYDKNIKILKLVLYFHHENSLYELIFLDTKFSFTIQQKALTIIFKKI